MFKWMILKHCKNVKMTNDSLKVWSVWWEVVWSRRSSSELCYWPWTHPIASVWSLLSACFNQKLFEQEQLLEIVLLAVADPLQELSCSLISAFPPTELFILHTILMKWSGWECMREDIFVKPNDFKTDFRSWPHRQLHWKSWRSGTANVTGNGREEGNRNLKIDQGRTVPWWDHSLAVCLHCSYCNPVRGLMQSVLQTAPWQRWCWYPLSTHWREKACRRQVMLPNPHGREFAQQKVKASSLLLALCCCWLNSLSW